MRRPIVWLFLVGASAGCEQILGITDVGSDDAGVAIDGGPIVDLRRGDGRTLGGGGDGPILDAALRDTAVLPDLTDPCASCGALGCCVDHCCVVMPSNASDVGALISTGLNIATPSSAQFDTDNDCLSTSSLGSCSVATPSGSPAICVCRMDTLTVKTLTVVGSRALALLASGTVAINGTLSVAAQHTSQGPGGIAYTGGGAYPLAGGSYGTRGGGNSPATFGTQALVPLVGGMTGQPGCAGEGGGGGGALQITAGVSITVMGAINAGGGGAAGGNGSACNYGGGGGSGGAVLLEAPTVDVPGVVAANGGGGGGGAASGYTNAAGGVGADANATTTTAYGGYGSSDNGCPLYGYTTGGGGGAGGVLAANGYPGSAGSSISGCLDGSETTYPGGGGGGVGRVRVNSKGGCQCAGTFSPGPSFGPLVVQ